MNAELTHCIFFFCVSMTNLLISDGTGKVISIVRAPSKALCHKFSAMHGHCGNQNLPPTEYFVKIDHRKSNHYCSVRWNASIVELTTEEEKQ